MDRPARDNQKNKTTVPGDSKHTGTRNISTEPIQTCCPNCHTQFYAYPQQLEANQNLVRCGLCLHIFNAQTCTVSNKKNQSATTPTFLKKRFNKTQILLMSACTTLSISFIILLAILFRAQLLEQLPDSLKVLQPICRLLACQLPPIRAIDAWAITHSELRKGKESNTYLLLSTLHNRFDAYVELPAIEISLLNPQGELVLRRTLDAPDYLPITQSPLLRNGLGGDASLPLEITLHTGDIASSYRLFLLYP